MPHGYLDVEVLRELFGTDRTEVASGSGVVGEDLQDDGLGHPRSITCGAASARVTTPIASTIRTTRIAAAITTTPDAAAYRVAFLQRRARAGVSWLHAQARRRARRRCGSTAAGWARSWTPLRAASTARPASPSAALALVLDLLHALRLFVAVVCRTAGRAPCGGRRRRAHPARAHLAASAPVGEHGLGGVAIAPALVQFGLYGSGLRLDLLDARDMLGRDRACPAPPLRRPAPAAPAHCEARSGYV